MWTSSELAHPIQTLPTVPYPWTSSFTLEQPTKTNVRDHILRQLVKRPEWDQPFQGIERRLVPPPFRSEEKLQLVHLGLESVVSRQYLVVLRLDVDPLEFHHGVLGLEVARLGFELVQFGL